ncbi:hypothetical protein MDMS009_2266 [Methylophaga thiooxydans DMS010]|uniref:Uncharacterized protein n=1 Tax=Methylophaga thiooxydans DMS010 TaxID=637616 RepID=C0N7B2_9GAMM|nr:hypothetical protein MDMS009_2266 [Methylophaga thiooxydans DMS010]
MFSKLIWLEQTSLINLVLDAVAKSSITWSALTFNAELSCLTFLNGD